MGPTLHSTVIDAPAARPRSRLGRWPARLDVAQSASGLALALFMWAHMFFVSSILVSRDAMWTIARFFEGYHFFGRSYPVLVSAVVAVVIGLFVAHAALALRKFPASYGQFRAFRDHAAQVRHADTTLWFWQVATGFALFFLASVHLYTMLTQPHRIGPFESADRVWSDRLWPLYLILLFTVEIHASIGLYRLAVKWGWLGDGDATVVRRRLKRAKWAITAFFVALGLATLAAYVRIGIEHEANYGQPYVPTHLRAAPTR